MVRNLPSDRIKRGTKILDIASKQGEFANALFKAYGSKIKDTIYSLPTSPLTYEFTRKVYDLLGLPVENVIENYNSYDLLNVKKKDKIMEELLKLDSDIIIGTLRPKITNAEVFILQHLLIPCFWSTTSVR